MKRAFRFFFPALAISAFLVSCAAPSAQQSQGSDRMQVYYAAVRDAGSLSGLIDSEQVSIPPSERDKLAYLIGRLFAQPKTPGLKSAFPEDSELVSYKLDAGKLSMVIGGSYGSLADMKLTIAESCAVLTLCEYPGVDSVEITPSGGKAGAARVLRKSDIVLSDTSLQPIEQEITLYYPDADRRYVVPEEHKIIIRENEQMERYVAEEFINGPRTDGLLQLIPEGTKLLSVVTEDRVCYINLSGEFIKNFSGTFMDERLIITAFANTLTSLDGIDSMQILVDGAKREFFHYLPVDKPLKADRDAVGPVDSQPGMEDITVYYPVPNQDSVAAVPKKVVGREGVDEGQLALEQLISGTPPYWSYNPVPEGTKLVSFGVTNGTCAVELSKEFFIGGTEGRAALDAVVATLTGINGISAVDIRSETGGTGGRLYSRADVKILE